MTLVPRKMKKHESAFGSRKGGQAAFSPIILGESTLFERRESAFLTIEKDSGKSDLDTTPGSFGERARGRPERNGPCIFRGCA